jgi:hypothetical protein
MTMTIEDDDVDNKRFHDGDNYRFHSYLGDALGRYKEREELLEE